MSAARRDFVVAPGGCLRGNAAVPGDKSISHRAVLLGGLSDGVTEVSGFLEGEDTLATLAAFEAMGVPIERRRTELVIRGRGLHGLSEPKGVLDLGNAGTGIRLLAGVLAGQRFDSVLTGDASLRGRPMGRVTEPLEAMGAHIESAPGGTAPLAVRGGAALRGIDYQLPVKSAQVKSALLLAGLYAEGRTVVRGAEGTRDHTERMLEGFGYEVRSGSDEVSLSGHGKLSGTTVAVPGDLSSAAFFMVGASIAPGSVLTLENVGVNPTRAGVLRVLEAMGASIELRNRRLAGGEPVADLEVRAAPLRGLDIPPEWVALAIDEFPILMVAAACADGVTTVRGAAELRVKESDRIAATASGLEALGVRCETFADGMAVHPGPLRGGEVSSQTDHRIAMSFALAGLVAQGPVRVRDCANVATSFPGFVSLARGLGLSIETEDVAEHEGV